MAHTGSEGASGGRPGAAAYSGIPIARMRSVYSLGEVGKKLGKLPPKEHESLRAT